MTKVYVLENGVVEVKDTKLPKEPVKDLEELKSNDDVTVTDWDEYFKSRQ